MAYGADNFVNREAEIHAFTDFIKDQRRVLLIYGPALIGKSAVIRRLREDQGMDETPPTLSVLVDFRDRDLLTGEQVIRCLRQRIGGTFSDHLAQVELQIQRDFSHSSAMVSAPAAIAAARSPDSPGYGGGVSVFAEQVEVSGDLVGRDKVIITNSPITVNSFGGLELAREEIETRRNIAFRSALAEFLTERRLVLFFDHFEDATVEAARWLRDQLLTLHLERTKEFANLWLVVVGRGILAWEQEVDEWRHVFHVHRIDPLSDQAIVLYWVEKRGLSGDDIDTIAKASGGKPGLLFLMANNFEMESGSMAASG